MFRRIIPRAEWGARYANGSGARKLPATQAWLHHTVTTAPDAIPPFDDEHAAMRDLERIGQNRFGAGISYTRLIFPSGNVYEGHGVDRIGTHTAGRNTVTIAYSLVGNYETAELPLEMEDAVAWALAHDFLNGHLDAVPLDGGHRDLKATACPGGHAYARIPAINAKAKAIVDSLVANPVPVPAPAPPAPKPPAPKPQVPYDGRIYGQSRPDVSEGPFVGQIQTLLKALGLYTGRIDNDFGPKTEAAVRSWQHRLGLSGRKVDGRWGPGTQAKTDAFFAYIARR